VQAQHTLILVVTDASVADPSAPASARVGTISVGAGGEAWMTEIRARLTLVNIHAIVAVPIVAWKAAAFVCTGRVDALRIVATVSCPPQALVYVFAIVAVAFVSLNACTSVTTDVIRALRVLITFIVASGTFIDVVAFESISDVAFVTRAIVRAWRVSTFSIEITGIALRIRTFVNLDAQ